MEKSFQLEVDIVSSCSLSLWRQKSKVLVQQLCSCSRDYPRGKVEKFTQRLVLVASSALLEQTFCVKPDLRLVPL